MSKSIYCTILLLAMQILVTAQSEEQKAMSKLNFMTGDWIGTSTTIKNNSITKEIPAYEKIRYLLDSSIITLDLKSESLQLHTVIYYDSKDKTYYYNPYYKGGAGKYPAEFKNGQLLVWFKDKKRLMFKLTREGYFQEYGEELKNGTWHKYFEDTFSK